MTWTGMGRPFGVHVKTLNCGGGLRPPCLSVNNMADRRSPLPRINRGFHPSSFGSRLPLDISACSALKQFVSWLDDTDIIA
jgi:hypothetical protein